MPNRLNNSDALLLSEFERRVVAYRFQAKMYVMTNIDLIITRFAEQIYADMTPSGERLDRSQNIESYLMSVSIIREYTQHIGSEILVLHNPKTREPAVLEDALIFTSYNIEAFEETLVLEYIDKLKSEKKVQGTTPLQSVGGIVTGGAKKAAAGAVLSHVGNKITAHANRFQQLATHYDGGHAARKRIQSSVRGKVAQRNAFMQMANKNKRLARQFAIRSWVGN